MNYKQELEQHYRDVHARLWGKINQPVIPKPPAIQPTGLSPKVVPVPIGGLASGTGLEIPEINTTVLFQDRRDSKALSRERFQRVLNRVSEAYQIDPDRICAKPANKFIITARHHFWWICHRVGKASVLRIGELSGFDHSTVVHGIHKHDERMKLGAQA